MHKMSSNIVKYLVLIIVYTSFSINTWGQEYSAAEEYYNDNINELPSDNYYNKNLKAGGWDDDDPGGSGEGDNTGVGNIPIGDAGYSLLLGIGIYCLLIIRKKDKQTKS